MTKKKTLSGLLDGFIPPSGFTLNEKLCYLISDSLVSAIKTNIRNTNSNSTSGLFPLPQVHVTTPHIIPIVTNDAKSFGQYFFIIGTHQQICSDSRSIASISINGRLYQGPLFNANGHKINWLIYQMLQVITLLIVYPILRVLIYSNTTFSVPRNFLFYSMVPSISATRSSCNSEYLNQYTLKNLI